jgi:uncharacterized protein YjbI with pentapeptide repeats
MEYSKADYDRAVSGDLDLFNADLRGADLRGLDLRGANLTEAELAGADLTGADLSGANLVGANLEGVKLGEVRLRGVNGSLTIDTSEVHPRNRRALDLTSEANVLRALDLRGLKTTTPRLTLGGDLSGADLSGADLTGVKFLRANLTRAKFTDLVGFPPNFEWCDLTDADLTGVKWEAWAFTTCIVSPSSDSDVAEAEAEVEAVVEAVDEEMEGFDFAETFEAEVLRRELADLEAKESPSPADRHNMKWLKARLKGGEMPSFPYIRDEGEVNSELHMVASDLEEINVAINDVEAQLAELTKRLNQLKSSKAELVELAQELEAEKAHRNKVENQKGLIARLIGK